MWLGNADVEVEARLAIARLYRVILDRAPDPGGLAHALGRVSRDGAWMGALAADMLRSPEFVEAVEDGAAADVLCRRALGRDAGEDERAMPTTALVLALIEAKPVVDRIGGLRALYPEGAPLTDRGVYRRWLAGSSAARAMAMAPPTDPEPGPVLSVIVPVEGADAEALAATARSVAAQKGPEGGGAAIELILVASGDALVPIDTEALGAPARVARALFARTAAAALDEALRVARGTFLCVLAPGERLGEAMLREMLAVAPAASVILSDEDAIDAEGPFRPAFNGLWDPDAALAGPPRCPVVIRTGLLREIGGFRPEADGAQDWDILLRAAAQVDGRRIVHVPAIFRHKPDGVRPQPAPPPGRTIVATHLDRLGPPGCRLDGDGMSIPLRVVYPLPATPPLASIIIPTRDRGDLLATCLAGLLDRTTYPSFEVLIVDNDSRDADTLALLDRAGADARIRVLRVGGAFNWSAFNNAAIAAMRGEVAVLLNNDTDVIEPDWLREMVSQAMRPAIGAVGAKLLYHDRTVQHAGIGLGDGHQAIHLWRHADGLAPGYLDQLRIVRRVPAATGACLALRRDVIHEVGGLEETHLKVAWGDVDLCLRVRAAGYAVLWTPHALLYHMELASRGPDDPARFAEEKAYMVRTWGAAADADPYRSPHLALCERDARFATVFD